MKEKFIAIVTGASRGIGKAIAQQLSKDGFRVILIARNKNTLLELASTLEESDPEDTVFSCDLSDQKNTLKLAEKITTQFSVIHTLVNNVGYGGPYVALNEISQNHWQNVWNININSTMYLMRAILPKMKKSHFGRIINISSILGLHGGSMSSAYSASKHATIGLTKSIATEWGNFGITCNAICPGYIDTEMNNTEAAEEIIEKISKKIPAGRLGKPKEIADLVSFLVSDKASYINGGIFVIDGGLTAHIST